MAKQTVEQSLSLSIGEFARKNVLAFPAGYGGTITWSRGGDVTAEISWARVSTGLRLTYSRAGQSQNYVVTVRYTRTNGGGQRPWWSCPRCGRRAGKLYLPPGSRIFACRACHDLAYAKQQARYSRSLLSFLRSTAFGRAIIAEALAESNEPAPASPHPVKRPRGRPRTKRKYTRRTLPKPEE